MSAGPPLHALAWDVVDSAYQQRLTPALGDRWLLVQTIATGASRRALLAGFGLRPGARVLDVGTGFGPIPLELAGMTRVDAVGVDSDPAKLEVAGVLADELRGKGWFDDASHVSFIEGDAYALPASPDLFDLATSRMLFQHLEDPQRASDELFRVVRPGGTACVIDVEDALSVSFPEPSEDYVRLHQVFQDVQARRGGDRHVGRTLSTLLDRSGFDVMAVVVLPQTAHGPSRPDDPARVFSHERLAGVRAEALDAGLIGAEEFDRRLAAFGQEQVERQCFVEAHLAVVARKPPGAGSPV
jgi:ubiquinone/menaquinone biosynthesis C-methylase UbiE